MCGVDTYGTLKGVSILEISETAGLGMRAESVLVPQLRNLNVDHITFTKVGKQAENEIDAISGATVTTTAFVNAVNASLDVFAEIAGKEAQHE
ncbi:MAG: FMN-binding protein [Lachnospiraceae bacterium]|nr:FMN-binding protein [Lachnospiraceae bacterium]